MTSMQITNNDNSNSPLQEHNTVETDEDIDTEACINVPKKAHEQTQISGRKVHSDEGIHKLGYSSVSNLIMRNKSKKFDSESPCYYVENTFNNFKDAELELIRLKTQYEVEFVIQKGIYGQKYYILPDQNISNLKDAVSELKELKKTYKDNDKYKFVIKKRISEPKYYIFPDPDDARHEEKFFKYTYMDDSDFNILKS
tara:strand:+ start:10 stop:603 length:594 start_codon:yes stop_codon:yes gene_type:complete